MDSPTDFKQYEASLLQRIKQLEDNLFEVRQDTANKENEHETNMVTLINDNMTAMRNMLDGHIQMLAYQDSLAIRREDKITDLLEKIKVLTKTINDFKGIIEVNQYVKVENKSLKKLLTERTNALALANTLKANTLKANTLLQINIPVQEHVPPPAYGMSPGIGFSPIKEKDVSSSSRSSTPTNIIIVEKEEDVIAV